MWTVSVVIWYHSFQGLSKAARVGHLKSIGSMAFFKMCGATSDDIIYITLPLYHMSASLLGMGGCIHLGKKNCPSIYLLWDKWMEVGRVGPIPSDIGLR